ncbi:hypothetical protein EDF62_3069 [Leucobacter luti]|uniref:Uncharacterized protein n=1 Tax=Leucobacter luti TaxID=340320 RepID=A0A4R6RSJ1_9MICO|nr:hypothetical protein [Leucobacter luti]TDP89772.1 hypothetical protein EDF62_3069 [Leucobacter luti]
MHAAADSIHIEHTSTRTMRIARHIDMPEGSATVELEISMAVTASQAMRPARSTPRHSSAPLAVDRIQAMHHLRAVSQ